MQSTPPKKPLPDGAIWAIVGVSLFLGALLRSNPQPARNLENTSDIVSNVPACAEQGTCNCSDFSSQELAQIALEAYPDDRSGLDRNHDGKACESLPSNFYDNDP